MTQREERRELATREDLLESVVHLLPVWQLALLRFNDEIARQLGIANSDLQCLFLLDRHGPSTPGVIARGTGLTSGATTRMVDRLVAAGLVAREPDAQDRRRVQVSIVTSASRRLHALYDPLDEELRSLLQHLDDLTLRQLQQFLQAAASTTSQRAASS